MIVTPKDIEALAKKYADLVLENITLTRRVSELEEQVKSLQPSESEDGS